MNKAAIPIQSNRKKNHRIYHRKIIILEDNFLFGKAAGGAIIKYFNLHDTMLYQSVIIAWEQYKEQAHSTKSMQCNMYILCIHILIIIYVFYFIYK